MFVKKRNTKKKRRIIKKKGHEQNAEMLNMSIIIILSEKILRSDIRSRLQ